MSCQNTFHAKSEKFQEPRNEELNRRLIQTSQAFLKHVSKYRSPHSALSITTIIIPTWLCGQPGSQPALPPLMLKAPRPTRGAELTTLEADELQITTLLHLWK